MGKTSIEWTDASWNPIVGCTEISPGCANCYAARLSTTPAYSGLAILKDGGEQLEGRNHWMRWTGEVRFLPERLEEPLHWRKPRRIFVCDMGDLFHESVHPGWLAEIFEVMRACPQHTFQVLTKRADRMREWIISRQILQDEDDRTGRTKGFFWPLPNVWLGVSVENQHFADERIPLLLATPAAVRWISAEPLLGPVDLELAQCSCPMRVPFGTNTRHLLDCKADCRRPDDPTRWAIDWIVCGGESGPNARPMHPDWARSLRDQCQAAGVPFFFKQWGEFVSVSQVEGVGAHYKFPDGTTVRKTGKKRAGRLLDGREWNEFPDQIHEGKKAKIKFEGTLLRGQT